MNLKQFLTVYALYLYLVGTAIHGLITASDTDAELSASKSVIFEVIKLATGIALLLRSSTTLYLAVAILGSQITLLSLNFQVSMVFDITNKLITNSILLLLALAAIMQLKFNGYFNDSLKIKDLI